jgi:hypothetical protein
LLGGCVYLLQLWMWHRIPVGRPVVHTRRPWFPAVPSRRRPTVAYIWDQVDIPFARSEHAYVEYTNELDTLTASQVSNICFFMAIYILKASLMFVNLPYNFAGYVAAI